MWPSRNQKILLNSIGPINYKAIRDLIVDQSLDNDHIICLNKNDFDNLIIEFRETYAQAFLIPIKIINVEIIERYDVPPGRIGVVKEEDLD